MQHLYHIAPKYTNIAFLLSFARVQLFSTYILLVLKNLAEENRKKEDILFFYIILPKLMLLIYFPISIFLQKHNTRK